MRRHAPATARNRQPILDVLRPHLPPSGLVLEVASGSGEHSAYFAQALPGLTFQPSDPDPAARASIDDWAATLGLANMRPALALDATADDWPIDRADAIVCINMVHISPWPATVGLVKGAARLLTPGGVLFLYGPYFRAGTPTAPSNAAFDRDLRAQNPDWGLRDLAEVTSLATRLRFTPPQITEMPANNLSLVFHATG
jgi:SAM-dependent methyltransferase